MDVIDVHCHFLPPGYATALRAGELADAVSPVLAAAMTSEATAVCRSVDERLEAMAGAGVTRSLLSLLPPGAQLENSGQAAWTAAMANDELLAIAAAHPSRFAVQLALPLPHVEESLAELARVGDDPLAVGVEVFATSAPWTLDAAELEPVYAAIAARGLPMMVHPGLEQLPDAYRDWNIDAAFAPVVSSSLGTLRLILSGMLDRVPALTLLVPHLGGVLPFLAQRLDDQTQGENALAPTEYLRTRLLFDSCSMHPPALRDTIETVGIERVLLGSDFPFRGALRRSVDNVDAQLGDEDRWAVLAGNAIRHFSRLAGDA